jgi:L-fucose isomerase-like protein
MPLISKFSLDDVYKQIKGEFRSIRANSLRLRTAAAAGPVSFSVVRDYLSSLTGSLAVMSDRVTRFGAETLAAYAQAQEAVPAYDVATEYNAMVTAANAVVTHISAAIPTNSAHTVTNGQVVEPTFSTAQTATLRALLDTLVGTIGAP